MAIKAIAIFEIMEEEAVQKEEAEMSASAVVEVGVAEEGMRVHAFSPNKKDSWGLGLIVRTEPGGYPKEIRLDSGRITEGVACWWHPVTRELVLDLVKRVMAKRWKINPVQVRDDSICQTPAAVFCRVVEDTFDMTNVSVCIKESLTVRELADMIWRYVA